MTHRTVPLDLLVRVRDELEDFGSYLFEEGNEDAADQLVPLVAELTAQIEREGQREPVAWRYKRRLSDNNWNYSKTIPVRLDEYIYEPLYTAPPAAPQDSVPQYGDGWAQRQADAGRIPQDEVESLQKWSDGMLRPRS